MATESLAHFDPLLGPVLLRCRLRPQNDVLWDAGLNPYIMGPFAVLGGALMMTVIAFALLNALGIVDMQRILQATYVLACIFLIWFCYLWPRRDYLILHEKGFRYAVTFTRCTVVFDELAEFRLGRVLPGWEKLAVNIGGLKMRSLPGITQTSADTSVTLVFRDARQRVLKGFLIRFNISDLERFLTYLADKYRLLRVPGSTPGTS